MTFATGGLLHRQSQILAQCYGERRERDAVKEAVLEHNLLRLRKISAPSDAFANRLQQYRACKPFEVTYLRLDGVPDGDAAP